MLATKNLCKLKNNNEKQIILENYTKDYNLISANLSENQLLNRTRKSF